MDLNAFQQQLTTDIATAREQYDTLTAEQRQALALRAEVVRLWQSLRSLKVADAGAHMADFLASDECQWLKGLQTQ
jgi:hypothetical protein